METNLGLEFNKRVYRNLHNNEALNLQYRIDNMELYKLLIETKLADLNPEQLNLKSRFGDEYSSFTLITSGQGLLIGTGNEHGTGAKVKIEKQIYGENIHIKIESHELKMGFYFDHSTGIPCITGHNLKGRLRSFFPIAYKKDKEKAVLNRIIDDFNNCFANEEEFKNKTWTKSDIESLQNILFEGIKTDKTKINPLKQDTFLGAYPSRGTTKNIVFTVSDRIANTTNYNGERDISISLGTFLFDDTLAYHPHPLFDPMPLRFLKILPDVEINFQFILNNEGIKKEHKVKLIKYLLQKYGIGAKTSSGYGQFKKDIINNARNPFLEIKNFNPITIDDIEQHDENSIPKGLTTLILNVNTKEFESSKETMLNSTIDATIINVGSGNIKVKPHYKDSAEISIQGKCVKKVGDIIKIKLTQKEGSEKKGNLFFTSAILQ